MSTLRDELASIVEACFSIRGYDPELLREAKWAPLADVAVGSCSFRNTPLDRVVFMSLPQFPDILG